MDLIVVLVICVAVGFLTWLLTTQVPMPAGYAKAIQVFVLIVLVFWVLTQVVNVPNVLRH